MDRTILPYSPHGGPPARPHAGPLMPAHAPAAPAKSPGDFARALRRRVWLVLLVALAVGVPGAVYVIRQPNVFSALAQIEISPPKFDHALSALIVNSGVANFDRESVEKYVPNKQAYLKSLSLAEAVVGDPVLSARLGSDGDPARELLGGLNIARMPGTNIFDVTMQGRDPERVALLLKGLIDKFQERTTDENEKSIKASIKHANDSLFELEKGKIDGLEALDDRINALLKNEAIISPSGKNLLEEQYVLSNSILAQKRYRYEELVQQERIARMFPRLKAEPPPTAARQRIDKLLEQKALLEERLTEYQRVIRDYANDSAPRRVEAKLAEIQQSIARLEAMERPALATPDLSRLQVDHSRDEIRKAEESIKELLGRMQQKMPAYQQYLGLVREREERMADIAAMKAKLRDFQMLSKTQVPPVRLLLEPVEPTVPSGPKRGLQLALVVFAGLALGIGLVCGLEWLDHRVKVPEQLTLGLSLPLFGVVPRIPRTAKVHRGGHLWTPGAPSSLGADAYRNLRASLLGLHGPRGPAVTLLITSAKAGEGKSTTALNLAATCARAGERTLLLDCDLRRPSLNEVFDDGHEVGLVDCLRGELPWQRAVVRTDIANLDFLPAGDPAGTPIEILGSLELRQLVTALAGYYDRVILDGPAVLGLADCRVLGRVVDATLLVVRSGAHELRPLQRAKAMLEQSQVAVAGVVFNGLSDDLENWSSDGPAALPAYGPTPAGPGSPVRAGAGA